MATPIPTPNEEAHLLSFLRASSALLAFHIRMTPGDMLLMCEMLTYLEQTSLKPHFQVAQPDALVTSDRWDSRSKCPEAFYLQNLNGQTIYKCPYNQTTINVAFHNIKTELQNLNPDDIEILKRAIEIPRELSIQTCYNFENLEPEVKSMFMAQSFVNKPGSASGGHQAACSYSIDDLLFMRVTLPYVICDVKKLEQSISSGFVKVPRQACADPQHYTCKSVAMKKIIDSEERPETPGANLSSDEEDIVYRGHPLRHTLREHRWCFRRENSADRPTQPISAPTGIEAQKAENFKKFYQAVVSPTHIRVTAGGRIVPNTRTLPQPLFTWNHKTLRFESGKLSPNDPQPWLQGATIELEGPSLQLGLPFPQPIRFGGFLRPQTSNHTLNSSSQKVTVSEAGAFQEMINPGGSSSIAPATHPSTASGGVILSPPTQFDCTKPFMYNGQLVYPMPPGFQVPSNIPVLPFNMLTNATASHQTFGPPTTASSASIPPIATPMATSPMTQFPGHIAGYLPVNMSNQNLPANFIPHSWATFEQLAAMRPVREPDTVDSLKSKIHCLEQQMKFTQQQLEGNKNPTHKQQLDDDRKCMNARLRALRATLLKLTEVNLPRGVSQAPISSTQSEAYLSIPNPIKNISVQASTANSIAEQTVICPASTTGNERPPNKNENPDEAGAQKGKFLPQKESVARKRLSAAAAMAPPFQPRSQQVILAQSKTFDKGSSPNDLIKSSKSPFENQALGVSNVGNWMAAAPSSASLAGPITHHLQTGSPSHFSAMQNSQVMSSFTVPGNFSPSMPEFSPSNYSTGITGDTGSGRPYLTGFSAPGVAIDQVDPKDLIYARPLTEEEIRARHLYWGKAPREVSKGLPKFDGRDFYPPTPVKNFTVPVSFKRGSHNRQALDLITSMRREALVSAYEPEKQMSFSEDSVDDPFHEYEKRSSTPINTEGEDLEDDDTETASLDSWGALKFSIKNMKFFEAAKTDKSASVKSSKVKEESIPKAGTVKPDFQAQANPTFLQSMLKNGPGGGLSYPLGGALSSATAHGYLPPYQGAALASLAPSMKIAHSSTRKFDNSPAHSSARKFSIGSAHTSAPKFSTGSAHARSGRTSKASLPTENRAPSRMTSNSYEEEGAVDLLRRIKDQDAASVHPGWNVNTTGIGPIAGADW